MIISQDQAPRLYHQLKASKKKLVRALCEVYFLTADPLLYAEIVRLNQAATEVNLEFCTQITAPTQPLSQTIKTNAAQYLAFSLSCRRNILLWACARQLLFALWTSALSCFVIAAGIAMAATHAGTIATIAFFLTIGCGMLLCSQYYVWLYAKKNQDHHFKKFSQHVHMLSEAKAQQAVLDTVLVNASTLIQCLAAKQMPPELNPDQPRTWPNLFLFRKNRERDNALSKQWYHFA